MEYKERKEWIKELVKKENKTPADFLKLGKAYARHIELLKEESKKRAEKLEKDIELFTTKI